MIRPFLTASALLASVVLPASAAFAQSEGAGRWSFEVGAATDNRSKHVSKTQTEGHIFGSATWESADQRFYVRPSFEGVRGNGADVEARVTAGLSRPIGRRPIVFRWATIACSVAGGTGKISPVNRVSSPDALT